mgnify:CR=1 FL=1
MLRAVVVVFLVNNAGRQQAIESLTDISDDKFDLTMKTNIYAPFWIIKAVDILQQ